MQEKKSSMDKILELQIIHWHVNGKQQPGPVPSDFLNSGKNKHHGDKESTENISNTSHWVLLITEV